MKNFVQEGDVLTVTAAAAVSGGDVVIIGDLAGIACTDAAIDESVEVNMEGVYTLPKAAGAVTQGAKLYWDSENKVVTTTAGSNAALGHAAYAADAAGPTVQVRLANRG